MYHESTLDKKNNLSLPAKLEALLFVSPEAVGITQLAISLDESIENVRKGLEELRAMLADPENGRGIRLQKYRGKVQLVTAPELSLYIEKFLGLGTETRLSRAALETLAIVLYKQPVTKPQIDAIRGVNSDSVLKGLEYRGLVQEVGRAEGPGRPILYAITPEVLNFFGITSLSDLPLLELEELTTPKENFEDDLLDNGVEKEW